MVGTGSTFAATAPVGVERPNPLPGPVGVGSGANNAEAVISANDLALNLSGQFINRGQFEVTNNLIIAAA
ncbi:hypothetical protein SAMN05192589_1382, partial [Paracidovorax valerianellae]